MRVEFVLPFDTAGSVADTATNVNDHVGVMMVIHPDDTDVKKLSDDCLMELQILKPAVVKGCGVNGMFHHLLQSDL